VSRWWPGPRSAVCPRWFPWDDHHEAGGTLALLLKPAVMEPTRADRGIRILLVDDSPSVRFFYQRLLTREGYQVEACPDPGTAFETAIHGDFDLAVVDYFMPGETGDRLCARLRADPRTAHIELAVLTGVYNDEVIRNCLEAGAVECLFKNEAESLFLARIGALWRSIVAHKAVAAGHSRLEAILTSAGDGIYGGRSAGSDHVHQRHGLPHPGHRRPAGGDGSLGPRTDPRHQPTGPPDPA
jgi:CheY-like chemotaxis protein